MHRCMPLLWLICPMLLAQAPRVLEQQIDVADLTKIELQANVGDIQIHVVEGPKIKIKVTLSAHKRGMFGNATKLAASIEEARLLHRIDNRSLLRLEVDAPYNKKYLQEDWTLEVPSHLGFELDLGVGNLNASGIRGNIDVNSGVGDVTLTQVSGSIEVDVGVGDVNITVSGADYKKIELDTGTGDAIFESPQGKSYDDNFVGGHLIWKGSGPHTLEVDAGVGDVMVRIN